MSDQIAESPQQREVRRARVDSWNVACLALAEMIAEVHAAHHATETALRHGKAECRIGALVQLSESVIQLQHTLAAVHAFLVGCNAAVAQARMPVNGEGPCHAKSACGN